MRENNHSMPPSATGYTEVFAGSGVIQAVTRVNGVARAQGVQAPAQAGKTTSVHFSGQPQTPRSRAARPEAPLVHR